MMYSNVLSAVVSALAADVIGNTSKQAWQNLYSPHNEGRADLSLLSSSKRHGSDRKVADCWLYARLHSQLSPRHWTALVAKFSLHKGKKVQAIAELIPLVASPAPALFLHKAVTAWAIPPLKGAKAGLERKAVHRSDIQCEKAKAPVAGRNTYGLGAMATQREQCIKRSTDMIVLPDGFYDISTWDPQGLNRTTYWRWKKAIETTLDEMVKDALSAAEVILAHEEILMSETA